MHARGQRDARIREIARLAEDINGLPADRRQENAEVAFRVTSSGYMPPVSSNSARRRSESLH